MATVASNGDDRRPRYPPPAPADWPLARRERYALRILADVAAIQLASLPGASLVRRILETPISELDHWATDPRYSGRALGLGTVPRQNRPRPGSLLDLHGSDILTMREAGATQREVAAALGCSQAAIARVEQKLNGVGGRAAKS